MSNFTRRQMFMLGLGTTSTVLTSKLLSSQAYAKIPKKVTFSGSGNSGDNKFTINKDGWETYCADPFWSAPDAGTYSTKSLDDYAEDEDWSNKKLERLKMVWYYSPQGPGFKKAFLGDYYKNKSTVKIPADNGKSHELGSEWVVHLAFPRVSRGYKIKDNGTVSMIHDNPGIEDGLNGMVDYYLDSIYEEYEKNPVNLDQVEAVVFNYKSDRKSQLMVAFHFEKIDTISLFVKKVVSTPDTSDDWSFTVTIKFTGTGRPADQTITLTKVKPQALVSDKIRPGVKWTIAEGAHTGYVVAYDNARGTAKAGETEMCTITNTRETGKLSIKKTMPSGTSEADRNKKFSITYTIKRNDANKSTYKTETISLSANDSAHVISNIPTGYTYTVTEAADSRYDTKITNGSGTISKAGATVSVTVQNSPHGYLQLTKDVTD